MLKFISKNYRNKSIKNKPLLIQMDGIDIYLSRKPIKNINLRIDKEGQVNVSAPLNCALSFIQCFLQERQDWIKQHRKRLLNQPPVIQPQYLTGESHVFLGKTYLLVIDEQSLQQRIILEGNSLCCYFKKPINPAQKQRLITQWHREQMKALLPELIKKWETIIGVTVNQWGIKSMKTRWGSCNPSRKRIWLSLHLIHKPLSCLEYVIVHELVHLLEASHNKRFYALMSQFMPEWRIQQQLLKIF